MRKDRFRFSSVHFQAPLRFRGLQLIHLLSEGAPRHNARQAIIIRFFCSSVRRSTTIRLNCTCDALLPLLLHVLWLCRLIICFLSDSLKSWQRFSAVVGACILDANLSYISCVLKKTNRTRSRDTYMPCDTKRQIALLINSALCCRTVALINVHALIMPN